MGREERRDFRRDDLLGHEVLSVSFVRPTEERCRGRRWVKPAQHKGSFYGEDSTVKIT